MVSSAGVRKHILAAFDELPPKQRQLARFFLNNEDIVAFASANEVGERVGTSAATVVRFCRALGYQGYTDLQAAIRTQFPQYRTAVQKMADRMANGDMMDDLPTRVAQANAQNVQETMSQVTTENLTRAVSAIISARKIRIFGSGLSTSAAVLAEFALRSLGLSARACLGSRASQAIEISQLTERDVVIVISIWRYLRETIEAAQSAHTVDATCIALTDSPVAPVARIADHVFVATTEGAAHSRSLTGIISLIDLLSAAIAAEKPHQSMEALRRLDKLYRENGILVSE